MAEICYFGGLVHYKSPSLPLSLHSLFRSKKPHYYNSTSLMAECLSSSTVEPPSLLVFSGGTGFNGVVEELKKLTTRVAHVLPVSDDGGSTAEIVRVLGGPAVGDIRSRCLRLSDESTSEALAVRRLLGHRLPIDAHQAKKDWYDIVEGNHSLWDGVSRPYSETIRAFLIYFQNEIHRRPNERFCFSNGSIGNFFFAGARIFFQSLDAAIFLFSRVSEIPCDSLVLPVISTNDRLTLGCELQDGTIIRGQNEISHPTTGTTQTVDKRHCSTSALPSKIKRVFYMSSEGNNLLHEVFPPVNPTVLEQLRSVDCIVYAMGSLFTSICPSLVLLGVGEIISSRSCRKVLLLNGSQDRETSRFTASCFVTAIADALNRTHGDTNIRLKNPPGYYINTLLVPKDGEIAVDLKQLSEQGIYDVVSISFLHLFPSLCAQQTLTVTSTLLQRVVESVGDPKHGILFNPSSLINTLAGLVE
ncbi:LPPG:FO 2-phospho-L-lactate transferase CofD/UPF0052 [Arabidopsis thaliana x Arabidopsis arenosa]|nr:maternal effect embryo arrest 18 [Arabidopsis thaliana]AEC08917.1 maternal effect embryo arrest 18 [Arabidopsis thaliana]KAG7638419.1 LPPG:FO 2-phospho-L-lactate transferase CofD/UPF0052 [Arabidopsis thaliana x Arabidopsis arenosa]|eukprot:NP_973595.1 maternal effect embryo arrest 18 [Arabidopsis thaliana]